MSLRVVDLCNQIAPSKVDIDQMLKFSGIAFLLELELVPQKLRHMLYLDILTILFAEISFTFSKCIQRKMLGCKIDTSILEIMPIHYISHISSELVIWIKFDRIYFWDK